MCLARLAFDLSALAFDRRGASRFLLVLIARLLRRVVCVALDCALLTERSHRLAAARPLSNYPMSR
jgi:hypothetical protein